VLGWAEVGCGSCRAGPQIGLEIAGQAENFPPVHISTLYAFAVCCHSNETRALIANPPNSVQLEGTLYHSAKLHPGPIHAVVWEFGKGQTDTHTDGCGQYTFYLSYASCSRQ